MNKTIKTKMKARYFGKIKENLQRIEPDDDFKCKILKLEAREQSNSKNTHLCHRVF
jgi:hypothetical protein